MAVDEHVGAPSSARRSEPVDPAANANQLPFEGAVERTGDRPWPHGLQLALRRQARGRHGRAALPSADLAGHVHPHAHGWHGRRIRQDDRHSGRAVVDDNRRVADVEQTGRRRDGRLHVDGGAAGPEGRSQVPVDRGLRRRRPWIRSIGRYRGPHKEVFTAAQPQPVAVEPAGGRGMLADYARGQDDVAPRHIRLRQAGRRVGQDAHVGGAVADRDRQAPAVGRDGVDRAADGDERPFR